jgi:hypothetical protein
MSSEGQGTDPAPEVDSAFGTDAQGGAKPEGVPEQDRQDTG